MSLMKKIIRYFLHLFNIDLKIEKYNKPILIDVKQAGNGSQMEVYFNIIKNHCNFKVENFFEVGANYCQDSFYVNKYFGISEKNIYCFEPNPDIFKKIKNNQFNTYDFAISDKTGEASFNITNTDEYNNSGISSLKRNKTVGVKLIKKVIVKTITLKNFMSTKKIQSIDFLKVDAEGNDYKVIRGTGNRIKDIKIIQIETARKEIFEGEIVFDQLNRYMNDSKFSLVYYRLSSDNLSGDALYINDRFLNNRKDYL